MIMMRSWTGEATPRTAPNEMRMQPDENSASIIASKSTWTNCKWLISDPVWASTVALVPLTVSLWSSPWALSKNQPWTRMAHWTVKAVNKKLKPSEDHEYLFKKVIKKPKPTMIITWTSWNPKIQVKVYVTMYRLFGCKVCNYIYN